FRRVSGATDALFLFSIISKAGLEKFEDFSRPALFLETYVTASFYKAILVTPRHCCALNTRKSTHAAVTGLVCCIDLF
ncbi:hypothetical protein, partial [Lactiplantibacillus pentosus]|uniref:hypothetical protein n=1 Tax=Lactiplantibacillus pentosus TaxID=1589 RepID=UPI001ADDC18D